MREKKHYITGELVAVHFPKKEHTDVSMLKRFEGFCYSVRSWRYFGAGGYMYTLEGCVSDEGVPYTFADEWLFPIGAWAEK